MGTFDNTSDNTSFGVFKPVGHVLVSFPSAAQADEAAHALADMGLSERLVRRFTDREMLEHIDRDLQRASPIAAIGQELNLIKAHRELAQRGYHWLVVRAPDREQALKVAECAHRHGAERAQLHGTFIIEELIEHPTDLAQVAESPDRGLDAQSPSGKEGERAAIRPEGARR